MTVRIKTFYAGWLPSPYGVLIFLTHGRRFHPNPRKTVAVPLRGSYLLNKIELETDKKIYQVAVPLRGSYLLNPVLYSPLFMLVPDPFCVAKPFSAYLITQKTQKPPANPLKSSCAGKHI